MAMNPNKKIIHPIETMINYTPSNVNKKPIEDKERKNFLISKELLKDYQCLCSIQGLDFSKYTVKLIQEAVDDNHKQIEEMQRLKK